MPLTTYKKAIIPYLINAARSLIPTFWRQTSAPATTDWITRVEDIRNIEETILAARRWSQTYQKIWYHWIHWLAMK
ncbi:Hypothetical predicted protein [Pelobates cultripes]|uniref:Uncharacterized protein n=1 Tax=Pelobates cultripes TaxID=61616 RepID=A0AAD1S4R9_PELCU|nr:Hypothetical predicted protein [Pelobates cultripes]